MDLTLATVHCFRRCPSITPIRPFKALFHHLESRGPDAGQRICLSTSEGLEFLPIAEIIYCEAGGSYTTFHLKNNRRIVVSKHLKEYENMLTGYPFFRVHNSYLINLREVRRFVKSEGGYLVMSDETSIPISSCHREAFLIRMAELDE